MPTSQFAERDSVTSTAHAPRNDQRPDPCERAGAVTRSLLGYGPLAGAVYLGSGVTQALTRDGFDLTRHDLSLLANGPLGWIQITTLVVTGLMTVAAATCVPRPAERARVTVGAGLLAGYGLALVAAGAFVADPMDGFPVGTPAGPPSEMSLAGLLHMAAGGIGFVCLVAAMLVLAGPLGRIPEPLGVVLPDHRARGARRLRGRGQRIDVLPCRARPLDRRGRRLGLARRRLRPPLSAHPAPHPTAGLDYCRPARFAMTRPTGPGTRMAQHR